MYKVSEQFLVDVLKTLKTLEHGRIENLEKVHKAESKAQELIRVIETEYLKR
jgi:hypothetical protein